MSNVYPLDRPIEAGDVTVITIGGNDNAPSFDPASNTTQITLPDGTVQISMGPPQIERQSKGFGDNLAEQLTDSELSSIASKLLDGIALDEQSRSAWLENISNGISLLGLEVKNPRGAAASGATPAEGTSTVDHPLLLEAVLRFQANARGELLPTDGPVKVRNDGEGSELAEQLSKALEKDMNHYLTKTAKEYYPDTDRMLLMLGFSGIAFKKGYHCPIKRRPVIASIDAKDLIVSNAATDIDGAGRVTHRQMTKPSTVRRMQLLGAWLDISLPLPSGTQEPNPVDSKINQVQGIAPQTYIEESDRDREILECYCEIEVPGFEHKLEGEATGLPLPYKVTMDKEARRILEIRRNWEEDDVFCMPRNRIVAYIFIPGLGFYGIGLLNVLGNSTKAVTAAWRLMIDAGMFANFPGFLYLKSLAKQLTNQFRVPPGGGMPIDAVGNDIRSSVMPLPYKDPSAVFISLIENIAQAAQRVGGTAELQIGEGKQDAPVGTTLALIEQATKLMSAVHKRLHQAQGQEFDMLKSLLMEDPEALWRHNKRSKVLEFLNAQAGNGPLLNAQDGAELRHRQMFLAALADRELIPAADPNTSSQTERYLKVVAMRQMAQTNTNIDLDKVDERAFRTMGVDDPESLFKQQDPNAPPAPPPPEQVMAEATKTAAQARLMDSQTKQGTAQLKLTSDRENNATKERIASLNVARELVIHNSEKQAGQQATQQEQATNQQQLTHDAQQGSLDRIHRLALAHVGHRANAAQGVADNLHKGLQDHLARRHEANENAQDRAADSQLAAMKPEGGVAPT